jgi:H+/Cl- antiporter ClcA
MGAGAEMMSRRCRLRAYLRRRDLSLRVGLAASKLIATSISLGSGSSRGIFSPSLFMGATIGGAFGATADSRAAISGGDEDSVARSSQMLLLRSRRLMLVDW